MGDKDGKDFLSPQTPPNKSRSRGSSPSGSSKSPSRISWNPSDILHKATELGDLDNVVRMLKVSPGCVDVRDSRGRTALHEAVRRGHTAIANVLLEHGADIDARSKMGFTPLTFAAERGHTEVMLALIKRGADLNAQAKGDFRGETPLHRAVLHKSHAAIQLLVVKGAAVNSVNAHGETAQQVAVKRGSHVHVLVLSAFGTNSDQKNVNGKSAMEAAQALGERRRAEIIDILKKWGHTSENTSDILRSQKSGKLSRFVDAQGSVDLVEMMCWASRNQVGAIVKYVLDMSRWARLRLVDSKDQSGWTALHHAALAGGYNMTQGLLGVGATVDSLTDKHRWTPLLLAAGKGRWRTVKMLLDHKADILAKTHNDETALDLAASGQHPKTVEVLVSRICDTDFLMKIKNTQRQKLATAERHKAEEIRKAATEEKTPKLSDTPSPSADMSLLTGAFDGAMFSVPQTGPGLVQSNTFDILINTWSDFFEYKEKDRRVKVAVLDTGFDSSHRDWDNPRALRFRDNKPESDPRERKDWKQRDRIKEFRDFCGGDDATRGQGGVDLDGHGTQVTGIVLRLAPRADIYVARICEGDRNRGLPPQAQAEETKKTSNTGPQPDAVAAAIDWAIQRKVDIINMSFGFEGRPPAVQEALRRAKQARILVFAAMSNGGNNGAGGAVWPARDPRYAIGIHSCKEWGKKTSDFTPPAVSKNDNLMMVGEAVVTHWPEAKGGGFRPGDGTSLATPVVASAAALVLAFWYQGKGRRERAEAERLVDLEELRENEVMSSLMRRKMGVPGENPDFCYVTPRLLWRDYQPRLPEHLTPEYKRRYAWGVIQDALSRL